MLKNSKEKISHDFRAGVSISYNADEFKLSVRRDFLYNYVIEDLLEIIKKYLILFFIEENIIPKYETDEDDAPLSELIIVTEHQNIARTKKWLIKDAYKYQLNERGAIIGEVVCFEITFETVKEWLLAIQMEAEKNIENETFGIVFPAI